MPDETASPVTTEQSSETPALAPDLQPPQIMVGDTVRVTKPFFGSAEVGEQGRVLALPADGDNKFTVEISNSETHDDGGTVSKSESTKYELLPADCLEIVLPTMHDVPGFGTVSSTGVALGGASVAEAYGSKVEPDHYPPLDPAASIAQAEQIKPLVPEIEESSSSEDEDFGDRGAGEGIISLPGPEGKGKDGPPSFRTDSTEYIEGIDLLPKMRSSELVGEMLAYKAWQSYGNDEVGDDTHAAIHARAAAVVQEIARRFHGSFTATGKDPSESVPPKEVDNSSSSSNEGGGDPENAKTE